MQRIILILGIIGFMVPTGLSAQKVYVKDGRVILDMTVAAGMPEKAMTNELKTPSYSSPSLTPSENNILVMTDGALNDQNHSLNKTVYQKLEISSDFSQLNWPKAFTYCIDLVEDGKTDWRLPTQRELQVMWIFNQALNAAMVNIGGKTFPVASHYSVTESSGQFAWFMEFSDGSINAGTSKSSSRRARCVREVVD